MTRLAEVKAELAATKADAWTDHMCLLLALTTKPDHIERFAIPGDAFRYVISAYGLTRCDGGYVVIRGICKGQRDMIHGYRFEAWHNDPAHTLDQPFKIAAERIRVAQYRLLQIAS